MLQRIPKPSSMSWRSKALAEIASIEVALYGDTYTLIVYDSKISTADPPREPLEIVWDRVRQNQDLFKEDGVPMGFPVGGNDDNPQYPHSGGNEKGGVPMGYPVGGSGNGGMDESLKAGTTNPVVGLHDAKGGNEKRGGGSSPFANASAPPSRWK
jgi:hypothetical protein